MCCDDIPELQTERLVLRLLTENDIQFIYDIFSLEETNRHVSNPPVKDIAEARDIFERFCKPKPHLFRMGIVLRETGNLIGTLGLYSIDMENKRATLGFELLPSCWGKGYMTEACKALLAHAFCSMGLNRIQASAEPENVRSMQVMERLGFTCEGVMRELDFYKGAFHDDVIYSILRGEWIELRKSSLSTS
jgi:ribosomal-protein-alanine N-acetyltransferase